MNDKEFLADAAKMDVDPLPGSEVDKLITSTPTDVAERYTKVMAPTPE